MAVDTVYASVGPKPVVFRLLLETAISGTDEALRPEQLAYVQQILAAPTAVEKVRIYAKAVCEINQRMAGLQVVLRDAASVVEELAAMREEIAQRRARNLRRFLQDLADTGQLRPDLDLDEAADAVWATSAPEMYTSSSPSGVVSRAVGVLARSDVDPALRALPTPAPRLIAAGRAAFRADRSANALAGNG